MFSLHSENVNCSYSHTQTVSESDVSLEFNSAAENFDFSARRGEREPYYQCVLTKGIEI